MSDDVEIDALTEPSNLAGVLHGLAILIVEDDPDTRGLYRLALHRAGAHVECASSAEAALAMLAISRPDVVLCDLHLPGVDGYGLIERVRANPRTVDIPFIAISGSHPSLERDRSRQAGFATHLTKPTKMLELVTAVRSVGDIAPSPADGRSRTCLVVREDCSKPGG